jgi:hypothetical protein
VLGALQTMGRPELAPTDPDLAALLFAALAQAQKMRRLLDELPAAASPADAAPLLPAEVADLIRRAAGTGEDRGIVAEVPDDLGPVHLPAPGLRRALAGILGRVGPDRNGARVEVTSRDGDCWFTITAGDGALPPVPSLSERLVAAMGGKIEQIETTASPAVRLVFAGVGGSALG